MKSEWGKCVFLRLTAPLGETGSHVASSGALTMFSSSSAQPWDASSSWSTTNRAGEESSATDVTFLRDGTMLPPVSTDVAPHRGSVAFPLFAHVGEVQEVPPSGTVRSYQLVLRGTPAVSDIW